MDSNARKIFPVEIEKVISRYLDLLDARLPRRVSGLYLTGSIALDDFIPGQSDIDFVTITASDLAEAELDQLELIHKQIKRSQPHLLFDGMYTTLEKLSHPADGHAPCCLEGVFQRSGGFAANPVTWAVLKKYPCPVRAIAGLNVFHDDDLLRGWCRQNLQSYWAGWIMKARSRPGRWIYSLFRASTSWGVLGVTRLHATMRTCDIISKSRAGEYALKTFPAQWKSIIDEALGVRSKQHPSLYRSPLARRRDTLTFMEYVINDAMN